MGIIVIDDKKNSLEVKNKAGEVLRTFVYAVGNYEQLQSFVDSSSEIEDLIAGMSDNPTHEKLSNARVMLEKQISAIIGVDGWEYFWENSANPHNILLCVAVLKELTKDLLEEMRSQNKGYV